jgi:Ni,Fe-hydrogenase maturation factor
MPSKVCLIGMQPADVAFTFGLEMSDIVNANIEKVIDLTIDKLKEWKIECVLPSPQKLST